QPPQPRPRRTSVQAAGGECRSVRLRRGSRGRGVLRLAPVALSCLANAWQGRRRMMVDRGTALGGAAAVIAMMALAAVGAAEAQQVPLKVIVFPGLSNLAILAAQHKGYFAKHNVAIEIVNTPNSDELRNGLAEGRYQIAHAAVDNAVSQIENQKHDVV